MNRNGLPLKGIKVVDLTWVGAGPLCTRVMAMSGAEVIRIESQKRIDLMRNVGPYRSGKAGNINASGRYNGMNNDKLGITLDLTSPKGLDLTKALIRRCDVVAHNFAAGVMQKLGLSYEDVKEIKPDVIYLAMTIMGEEGPHRGFRGFGTHISALAGINHLTGLPERPPGVFSFAYPDFTSNPYHASVAVLAALFHRRKTGEGQLIDLAQYESTLCLVGPAILQYTANGQVPQRRGNNVDYAMPHGAFPCAGSDRWCVIAVTCEQEWEGLCRALGSPEWCLDPKFATFSARSENEEVLNERLSTWTRALPPEEVMQLLQKEGVPAGVVRDFQELLDKDLQIQHRQFYTPMEHPEGGPIRYSGMAYRSSEARWSVEQNAPCLGQHNDYVFKDILGLSSAEMAQLKEEGVIA